MKPLFFIIAFVMAISLASAQTTLSSAATAGKRKAKAVAIFAPRPRYPVDAQGRRPTGRGIVVMEINRETGWVISTKMEKSTGNKLLDHATIEAFSRWRFKPGTVRYVRSPITFIVNGQSRSNRIDLMRQHEEASQIPPKPP
jgi:TonB family protein